MDSPIVVDPSPPRVRLVPHLEVDDAEIEERVPWTGEIVAFDGSFYFCLHGLELGRTSVLVSGDVLPQGRHVTLTLDVGGERVHVLARVEWSTITGDTAISRLRPSMTSPRGNELIASLIEGRAGSPEHSEHAETDEITLGGDVDEEQDVTAVWQRDRGPGTRGKPRR
jgi:hypothetical protein